MKCESCDGSGSVFQIDPCWNVPHMRKFRICKECWGRGVTHKTFNPPIIFVGSKGFPHLNQELIVGKAKGNIETLSVSEFPNSAAVAVHFGVFPSLNQARKNGFDKVLSPGDVVTFKKKGISVQMT